MKARQWLGRVIGLFMMLAAGLCLGQETQRESLIGALQGGGYVIVMRHASSPRQPPEAGSANADNINRERQLDEVGRESAQAMGVALRRLGISIQEVASSPTYRAMETARLMGFESIDTYRELGAEDMRTAPETYADWLRNKLAEPVETGNRLLISHAPVIGNAFPEQGRGLEDGEALIFGPGGMETAAFVSKVKIHEWGEF